MTRLYRWRCTEAMLSAAVWQWLHDLTLTTNRAPAIAADQNRVRRWGSNGKRVTLAGEHTGPDGSPDWLVLHRTLYEHSIFTQGAVDQWG